MTNEEHLLEDPRNHVVCVFDDRKQADQACQELAEMGVPDGQIQEAQGEEAAQDVDASPKWFADTDDEIRRFKEELKLGNTVLSVPIAEKQSREKVHAVLKRRDARYITHFGEWVTELMR